VNQYSPAFCAIASEFVYTNELWLFCKLSCRRDCHGSKMPADWQRTIDWK
jgi:hypothetical protein